MRPSRRAAHDAGVQRPILAVALAGALALSATAAATLTPGRTVVNGAPVTALSVTGRSVVYAVGRTRGNCDTVRLWDTAAGGLWTFGARTIVACEENPSGGFGIAQVATAGRRAFWVTNIGGNITDYQLWTATPTRRTARRLAFASSETGAPPAIVLGAGTDDGVPYAVGATITYVSASGARLFRTTLGSPVRLLTSGSGVGTARILAALADGRVVLLSKTGVVLRTDAYDPSTVRAIGFALVGPLVQADATVNVGPFAGGTKVTLPAGALMLDYRQGRIVYRKGAQARARQIATGNDTLLATIPVKPWQPMLFSTDSLGSAWARGLAVSWRSGPLS
jgi:hypothetical protein